MVPDMSTWVIISWVFVGILTAINVVVFVKLKQASEQMMKMAFPGAKNMQDAMAQAQKMMGAMGGGRGVPPGFGAAGRGGGRGGAQAGRSDAQLQAAMEMLQNMQKKK